MLNLPIKILKTVQIEAETDSITIDGIDELVAVWDARQHITSRHLVLIINARSIDVSDYITNFLRFNGSAAMDYMYQRLSGVGVADSAGRVDGANAINLPPICGANNANTWGGSMVLIPHAFNTTNHKALLALGGASEYAVEAVVGRWAQPAAITSVTILEGVGDDFVVGSTFHLGVIDERYLVEEINLAGNGPVVFENIPQGEGDLAVVAFAKSDRAAIFDNTLCFYNDDVTITNYWRQYIEGAGAATNANSVNNASLQMMVTGVNANANEFGAFIDFISQFTKGNQPHGLTIGGYHSSVTPEGRIAMNSRRRNNIEPINKLQYSPNTGTEFVTGSLFSLYRVPKRIIERVIIPPGGQATITFTNIPQNFEALQLNVYCRSNAAVVAATVNISFNNDVVAANYDEQYLHGMGAAVVAARHAAEWRLFICPAANEAAGEFGVCSIMIPGYAETDRHKHYFGIEGRNENYVSIRSHRWESLNAITEIDLTTTGIFIEGSVFELEGILRKEGLPPDEGEQWGV